MARSLIEQWFPAAVVGAESLRERGSAKAYPPINFLHAWWARRPLTASRAAVLGSVLPAWPSDEDTCRDSELAELRESLVAEFPAGEASYHAWFVRTLGILGNPVAARAAIASARARGERTTGNAYGYDRAFTVSPDDASIERIRRLAELRTRRLDEIPTVLDPFGGGGSIPFEALRIGLSVSVNELNPVAYAILQGTVDLPRRLGPDFGEVIASYGGAWAERVRERLSPYFPHQRPEEANAYIWAHTVPCPSTSLPTPLAPNFWLDRGNVAVRLDVDPGSQTVRCVPVTGSSAKAAGDRATYRGGTGWSIWDPDAVLSADYIKESAVAGRMGEMLLATAVSLPGRSGRTFRAPTEEDSAAVAAAKAELTRRLPGWLVDDLVPQEVIRPGSKTDEPIRMGIDRWDKMFTSRQLLTNVTALDELRGVLGEARVELDELSWRALTLYLAFAFDRATNYNARLSGWDPGDVGVSNVFDRHDFAFKWSFGEFDGSNGLIDWTVKNAVANHRRVSSLAFRGPSLFEGEASLVDIRLGPAEALSLPDESVDTVVTDPPYYDNVQYAELSDFFLVWLKRILRDAWPEYLGIDQADREREAVANPSLFRDLATHSGRGRRSEGGVTAAELADRHYEQLLTDSFREAHRVLRPDGVMTVMFTHKRVDAWDTLGIALLEAGFEIASSWPVHTESENSLHQARKNSASSTIMLGCRKRSAVGEPSYWADIRAEVESAAEDAAQRFALDGIRGVDLTLATYGPALSVLSRHWPVFTGSTDTDGNPVVIRPDVALDLARERVAHLKKRQLLGGRDIEFDRATDWWLLAWSDFQAAQFPAGEALKLCLATDVELDEVSRGYKLVKAQGGNVTLLTPAQRRTAGALTLDSVESRSLVDALHVFMLTYDEEGVAAASRWLEQTQLGESESFKAVFQAALNAVPRTRLGEEFARPEARILESIRASVFGDTIPAPAEPELAVAQASLFDED